MTVFDGNTLHENAYFLFSDSTIVAISPRPVRFRKAAVIDGRGQTILPPLINAHVHLREPQNLKDALQHGIFALLDMFSTDDRAQFLRSFNDSLQYARCYSANFGATVPGGHGTQFRVEIPVIEEGMTPAQFVEERRGQGADYIKVTQEASMARLSEDQLAELARAAEKHDLKTVGHISDLENAVLLAEAGINGLAHIWYRNGSVADPEVLARFRQKDLFIIPTLSVIEKVLARAEAIGVGEDYLPFASVLQEVREAHRAGIPILAGTDAPNYGMDYTTQLFTELQLLRRCGLSNTETLQAATTNIYEAFELEGFGLLKKGALASFVLVEGQPVEDLADLNNFKRVWKKGAEIRPDGGAPAGRSGNRP